MRHAPPIAPVLLALLLLAPFRAPRAEEPADDGAAVPEAPEYDGARVGVLPDGRVVVPTNQVLQPAGEQIDFAGRPTDIAIRPDGRFVAVLNRHDVVVIPTTPPHAPRIFRYEPTSAGGSYTGILYSPDGSRLYASCIRGTIAVFDVADDGSLTPRDPIVLPAERGGSALPAGMAVDEDGGRLFVALNLNNTLGVVDLRKGELVRQIPVGNAPYDVALIDGKAYVSNWAGRLPGEGDPVGPSGRGTPVRVDPKRHIASEGSVSVVDLASNTVLAEIICGRHASGLAVHPSGRIFVANANDDTVIVIDALTDRVVETISTLPAPDLLFGSAPNALTVSRDGRRLYVCNGANNAVAVIELGADAAPTGAGKGLPAHSRLLGLIPTGWYPAGIAMDEDAGRIYVANVKGIGSRNATWRGKRTLRGKVVYGYNSHDYRGTASIIPIPDDDDLEKLTEIVLTNNRLTESISALAPPRPGRAPRPVPERHGEPSLFEHVIYIIKENRTYDQVFGDMEQGEGDPSLCIFGREVTPNHHALAEQFVLFDNFYCSGTLSADGHQWTDEAYVTDYLEKSYGGFVRSYPYDGGDALAYAGSGFIWDNVLDHGKTLRVYGEFVSASIRWKDPDRKDPITFLDCYRDFIEGTDRIEIRAKARIRTIEPYICPSYIGFPYLVPDVYRADRFIRELREFEKTGDLPDFCIMLLPNDHTAGTAPGRPTPAAAVADNDLALGRIVEAVSHSRFWKNTCIFVVQDDPQNGFDHIDGHRTVALVLSPYTRRGFVDHTNYNQTSMFRTIELILGLPPMNQFDSSATPMTSCFRETPDFTPYKAVPNRIPLDRMNPEVESIRDPAQRRWAVASLSLPLDDVDEADEDLLNRILWHAMTGDDESYPSWAVLAEAEEDED